MEVFQWYLANEDGFDVNAASLTCATELPQFLVCVDAFIRPLYALLLENRQPPTELQVFDKTVYADPRLRDASLWDGTDLLEIKRVNPELIRLLAGVSSRKATQLADAWFRSPGLGDLVPHWESEADKGQGELCAVMKNIVKLAKRSIKTKKDVMERFFWATQ